MYPEVDLRNLTILRKVLDFVDNGGIFVNVSDIPTYWAYHVKLKRKVDTTKAIFTYSNNQLTPIRPFQLTPLMKELGLSILNIRLKQDFSSFSQSQVNIFSERVAIMESNLLKLIPENILVNVNGCSDEKWDISYLHLSAFFAAKYGEGDFIFSLAFLHNGIHSTQEKEIVKRAIVQASLNKIDEFSKLHSKSNAKA